MQLGIIGLGRMGANITRRRLMRAGHHCAVYDINAAPREALGKEGAFAATSISELVAGLTAPRALLGDAAGRGRSPSTPSSSCRRCWRRADTIIDGGNSYYKDDIRRSEALQDRGIHYVDVGTSGGVLGS